MTVPEFIAWFASGGLLINTLPHLVSGLQGRSFQSPFGKPPGIGVSSPASNVLWGFVNLAIAWALLTRVGEFDLANAGHAAAIAIGGLLSGVLLARHFGKFYATGS